ncbi:MAG: twin-arginine translocase subunit TatC [Acidimicrobiales bacterium]
MKLPGRGKPPKPKVATPDDRMTLVEHLAELRTRIIRSLLAIVLGIIVMLAFYDQVLNFLGHPYKSFCELKPDYCELSSGNFQFTSPLEGFSTRLSIATYGGILIALPVLMWQIWRFVVPALHAKEKKYAIPFVLSSVGLFALGGAVAYWTLEKALEFLITWSGSSDNVQGNFKVSEYINLVGLMVAAFGIAFEFPVLLVFLQLVGVLQPQTLTKQWRYAVLIIFVIAAVITPSGDPYSMMALAVPMTLFYVISILIGLMAQKRKRARDAAA